MEAALVQMGSEVGELFFSFHHHFHRLSQTLQASWQTSSQFRAEQVVLVCKQEQRLHQNPQKQLAS